MTKALLGCIADDFTGATDLANMLVRGGMRAVQTIGVPASDTSATFDPPFSRPTNSAARAASLCSW